MSAAINGQNYLVTKIRDKAHTLQTQQLVVDTWLGNLQSSVVVNHYILSVTGVKSNH